MKNSFIAHNDSYLMHLMSIRAESMNNSMNSNLFIQNRYKPNFLLRIFNNNNNNKTLKSWIRTLLQLKTNEVRLH